MSTTLTASATPAAEQRELLHQIRACADKVSALRTDRVKKAVEALKRATHTSPLLQCLDFAGREELLDRLEDELEGDEKPEIKRWVTKCVDDIKAYEKAEERLADAEARIEFYNIQARNAQELFVYTIM